MNSASGLRAASTSGIAAIESGGGKKRWLIGGAAAMVLLTVGIAAYHFGGGGKNTSPPGKITQISHCDKPMNRARLSPDGHTVAFSSPVNGIMQVFVMLTSGGDPLQLTIDEDDKDVSNFSADGTKIYFEKVFGGETRSVPTLGGSSKRVLTGVASATSPDGKSIYFSKVRTRAIFREDHTGLGDEQIAALGGRKCHPEDLRTCQLTHITAHFESMTTSGGIRFEPLVNLLNGLSRKTDIPDSWSRITARVAGMFDGKMQILTSVSSTNGQLLAVCVETKNWLGLKIRQRGFLYVFRDRAPVGRIVLGKRGVDVWTLEKVL